MATGSGGCGGLGGFFVGFAGEEVAAQYDQTQTDDVGCCCGQDCDHDVWGKFEPWKSDGFDGCICGSYNNQYDDEVADDDAQSPFFKSSAGVGVFNYAMEAGNAFGFVDVFFLLEVFKEFADDFKGV